MHRHGYKGRKFGRKCDQRTALMRSLLHALFTHTSITTTTARAKETRRLAEKLITLARRGDLHSRRLLIARLDSNQTANRLVDLIAPQIKRESGYLKLERAGFRRGDMAPMSTLSFVDPISLDDSIKGALTLAKAKKPAARATIAKDVKASTPAPAHQAAQTADKKAAASRANSVKTKKEVQA